MGIAIALINQKGGVGKTTSSMNIAMSLSLLGKKVLMIDADAQCDLSTSFGIFEHGYTIQNFLSQEALPDLRSIEVSNNLFLISGFSDLLELKLTKKTFEEPIKKITDRFDFIIMDCQPQRVVQSKLTINECILNISDYLLLPLDANYNSIKGTLDFIQSVDRIKVAYNHNLKILGLFFTMVNERELLFQEFKDYLKSQNSDLLIDTFIRRDINVKKSQSVNKPLALFNNKANSFRDYEDLVNELIVRMKI
ncbi:ParA family protein [bacterium]|nr:MAG: ParA family protein [bacterium]